MMRKCAHPMSPTPSHGRRSALARLGRRCILLTVLLGAVPAFVLGCETTVEDVREWENAKRRAEKMKEFILDEDNALEVKTEATMILVRRNESSNIESIFEELDEATRKSIIDGVVPQLEEMLASEDQANQLKAKDGAYYVARTKPDDETRERLDQVMIKWIDGDNFHRPSAQAGLAHQDMVLDALGPKGMPVLENVIEEKFDKLAGAETDEFKNKKASEILGIVNKAEQLNLGDVDAMVARVFVARAEKMYPELHEVFDIPFEKNKTDALKPLAEKIVLDPSYTNGLLNNRKAFIINTYYTQVQPKEGIRVCSKVVREDKSGFLRWMCAQTLLKVASDEGIDHVMLGLPDDPAALAMPEDHPLAEHPDKVGEFWTETASFCRASGALSAKAPLEKYRKYLQSTRTVERVVAIECLSYLGTPEDIAALTALTDTTDLSAWAPPGVETPTLQTFAAHAAAEHPSRKAQMSAMQGN